LLSAEPVTGGNQKLCAAAQIHDPDLVEYAFERAAEMGQKNLAYVRGILNRLRGRGIKDMGDMADYDMSHEGRENITSTIRTRTANEKLLLDTFSAICRTHSGWEVWSDFCYMFAAAISNSIDKSQYENREKRYLQLIRRYDKEDQQRFPHHGTGRH
jgi:hypothetical protein